MFFRVKEKSCESVTDLQLFSKIFIFFVTKQEILTLIDKEVEWVQDFEKVYVEYLRDVYNFLLKLSGSEDIAEELTQSTFSIAFENMEKFRGTCKMSVWLCQIAKHEYFAYCRKRKRIAKEAAAGEEPWEESPEERFIAYDEQIRIHQILHVLPEPYKEVFTLRVMAELSYQDISRLFGKSESWARVTYYRAKCMIIERLERGGENEM